MRRLMRAEASTLAKELTKHQDALKKRLQKLEKRMQKDSDNVLLSELGTIRDELSSVRRGLARVSLSEQSTLKLKNEWHDWMRHEEASEGIDHLLREERLEMVASELRLRGCDVPEPRATHASETAPLEIETESAAQIVPEAPMEDVLFEAVIESDEETEEMVDWTTVGEYWDQLIAGCHPGHTDVLQLARLLKGFRDVQGERKRADRRQGVRRYRLTAFETWT